MIANARLLHYLGETTYKKICGKFCLDVSPSKIGDNYAVFPDALITKVHLFNIAYQQFGHIWFMHTDINFPGFACSSGDFPKKLYDAYGELFGTDAMSDFPQYEALNCDYIEYTAVIELDAERSIAQLANNKCVPEQLDASLWSRFEKPHSTISFYACQIDKTHIDTLAKCHGTALKRLIKDPDSHRATGIAPCIAFQKETVSLVLNSQYQKHFFTDMFDSRKIRFD